MRVLLITYYFPPFNSVGAIRPGKFARWLHEQGHDVHVLTCNNQPFEKGLPLEIPPSYVTAVPGWSVNAPAVWLRGGRKKVAREGFGTTTSSESMVGRLGKLYKTLLHWPDGQIGWVPAAIRAGRDMLRHKQYELIYVSAPPFSTLQVAVTLAREARLPWIAEFRDLWTENHAYDAPKWRHAIERRWESQLLSSVAGLVTVSAPLVSSLQRFGKPVWEVRNGYEPEDFENLSMPSGFAKSTDVLDIVFTGNIYDSYYDVDSFCSGLALFAHVGGQVRVHVAGRNTGALKACAKRHGIANLFAFHNQLIRPEALAMQIHADVLLAFLWNDASQEGIYSAKLFEYAGAGHPVLAVGPNNDVGSLIELSGLGRSCSTGEQVATVLDEFRAQKKRTGHLAARIKPSYDFTRSAQFSYLISKLNGVVSHHHLQRFDPTKVVS